MGKKGKNNQKTNKQKDSFLSLSLKATNGTLIKNIIFIIIILLHFSRDWEIVGILKSLKQPAENTTMQVIR